MFRVGNSIFNERHVMAIDLNEWFPPECRIVKVILNNGATVPITVSTKDVIRELEAAGLLVQAAPPDDEPVSTVSPEQIFSPDERAEMYDAYMKGYHFAAKDELGAVFAFSGCPVKGAHSWINDDERSKVKRLEAGNYPILSFTDDWPLDIAAALGEA